MKTPNVVAVYTHIRKTQLLRQCMALALCIGVSGNSGAEAYRSKVYLDPSKKIDESISLSIEQLEQQLGGYTDSYSKASAGRHLARHYVAEKQYDKAVDFYQQALASQGLSELANLEMSRELATVFMLQKQYEKALALLLELKPRLAEIDVPFLLLLGQAQFKSGDFLALADTLDELMLQRSKLSETQLQQLLSMAYGARNYAQCETILALLIDKNAQNMTYWRQLVSIYLSQNKHRQALDRLALAREKQLTFSEDDIKLLGNLYLSNQAAEKGARTLSDALASGELTSNAEHYRQLFEYWLVAREKNKATDALQKAAAYSGDTALYLKLAQLYMEQERWSDMGTTVLQACQKPLRDRYVGKANLLLGISQFKQQDVTAARRSLINATLMGSQWQKANQWLGFMQAAPATAKEMRRIEGPCAPKDPNVRVVEDAVQIAENSQSVSETSDAAPVLAAATGIQTKVADGALFYLTKAQVKSDDMARELRSLMVPLGINLVRNGGAIAGPLHLFFVGDSVIQGDKVSLAAGFPVRGNPASKGRYKRQKRGPFKCAYFMFEGDGAALREAWERLFREALQSGYELTGEARQIMAVSNEPGVIKAELQLGIK